METVSSAAGMDFSEEGGSTTAGIMGTVGRNGDVTKGNLSGSGFVAWKEAQTLLKSADQTHSSDILEVMNMALDPEGKVEKSMSGGKLEYSSRTSMYCTTYPPEPDDQLDLVTQGFLPRTLFFYRRVSEDFYDNVNKKRDSGIPRRGKDNGMDRLQYEDDIEKLGNTLKYINETVNKHGEIYVKGESHYAKADKHIDYFKAVEDGVSIDPSNMLNEVMEEYTHEVRKTVKPFKSRMFDLTYKIAAALAAVDYDEENDIYVSRYIKERHVTQAKKIVEESWRNVLNFTGDYMTHSTGKKLRQVERAVQDVARNNDGEAKIQDVMSEVYMQRSELKSKLAALEEMDKIQSNGTPIMSVDPDDKVIIEELKA